MLSTLILVARVEDSRLKSVHIERVLARASVGVLVVRVWERQTEVGVSEFTLRTQFRWEYITSLSFFFLSTSLTLFLSLTLSPSFSLSFSLSPFVFVSFSLSHSFSLSLSQNTKRVQCSVKHDSQLSSRNSQLLPPLTPPLPRKKNMKRQVPTFCWVPDRRVSCLTSKKSLQLH